MARLGVGLALSGGGFRAALFHLGVVRFLHEAGLLSKITHICAVSGGSILAAHLVKNWDRYNGTEATFDRAAAEIVAFVRKDVRGRVVRRWFFTLVNPLGWLLRRHWGRSRVLEREYETLYGKHALSELGKSHEGNAKFPELHLLVTNMTTGELCSFSQSGFFWRDGAQEKSMIASLPIARAVAASSAFPPLFPPIPITHKDLSCSPKEFYSDPQYLADGGVFDNLGIGKLLALQKSGAHFDRLIVSDAETMFDWAIGSAFKWLPTRATRASEILMTRVSDLEYRMLENEAVLLTCRLQEVVPRDEDALAQEEQIQRSLRGVRTDMDVFTSSEINALAGHGYAAARLACKGYMPADTPLPGSASPRWCPCPAKKPEAAPGAGIEDLSRSKRRRWRLVAPSDWASWGIWLTLFAYPTLPFVWARLQQRELEEQVAQLETDVRKLERAFINAAESYARRLRLSPSVEISFATPSQPGVLGTWDPEEQIYRVSRQKVGTPGLAEFVAVDGWFMAKHYGQCFGDGEIRVDALFWLKFRYSVVHYVIASEDPRKPDKLMREIPHANGSIFEAFQRVEKELGGRSGPVRKLALALLDQFDCDWTEETLPAKALDINKKMGLIDREVIKDAFAALRGT